jgi:hypothetical protein
MIQVVSFPPDPNNWNQNEHPFYFEVYGETEPVLDMQYGEVVPAGKTEAESASATPIYEFWWSIGHGGHKQAHRHRFSHRKKSLWSKLDNPAARVYLFFPISGGWRAKELIATVKYLSPVHDQENWTQRAASEWQALAPVVADAGSLASSLAPVPGVGTVAAGAAPILSAMSKLKIGSVPQSVKGFDWYVEKVTFGSHERGIMQGICWTLPRVMFDLLGGRLAGSVALSFVPMQRQDGNSKDWQPMTASVLAHASVRFDRAEKWVPAEDDFIELRISPRTNIAEASPDLDPHLG